MNSVISDEGELIHHGDRRWEAIAQPVDDWYSGKVATRALAVVAARGHGVGKYVVSSYTAYIDRHGARWLQNPGGSVLTVD